MDYLSEWTDFVFLIETFLNFPFFLLQFAISSNLIVFLILCTISDIRLLVSFSRAFFLQLKRLEKPLTSYYFLFLHNTSIILYFTLDFPSTVKHFKTYGNCNKLSNLRTSWLYFLRHCVERALIVNCPETTDVRTRFALAFWWWWIEYYFVTMKKKNQFEFFCWQNIQLNRKNKLTQMPRSTKPHSSHSRSHHVHFFKVHEPV